MVSPSTVRVDTYATVRSLVTLNLPVGVTLVNSYPEANPSFPCVVMPMPDAGASGSLSFDGSKRDYEVSIEFTFWASATGTGQGQAKIAQMMDAVQAALEANQTSGTALLSDNLILVSWSPSSVERIEVNQQKLYTAGLMATFMVTA